MKLHKPLAVTMVAIVLGLPLLAQAEGDWKRGRVYYRMVCTACPARQKNGRPRGRPSVLLPVNPGPQPVSSHPVIIALMCDSGVCPAVVRYTWAMKKIKTMNAPAVWKNATHCSDRNPSTPHSRHWP